MAGMPSCACKARVREGGGAPETGTRHIRKPRYRGKGTPPPRWLAQELNSCDANWRSKPTIQLRSRLTFNMIVSMEELQQSS